MDKKVSVIIPYDHDRGWLAEAVESAKSQRGLIYNVDFEIIVQQGYENIGVNFNRALDKAKGEYIKILAEDDMLTENCLFDLYHYGNGCDVICADSQEFTEVGKTNLVFSHIPETLDEFARGNTIHGGTLLWKRSALLGVGGFDPDLWTAEEYDVNLRLAAEGYRFGYVNSIVYKYRIHNRQKGIYCAKHPTTKEYKYEAVERIQGRYLNNYQKINK